MTKDSLDSWKTTRGRFSLTTRKSPSILLKVVCSFVYLVHTEQRKNEWAVVAALALAPTFVRLACNPSPFILHIKRQFVKLWRFFRRVSVKSTAYVYVSDFAFDDSNSNACVCVCVCNRRRRKRKKKAVWTGKGMDFWKWEVSGLTCDGWASASICNLCYWAR